MQRSQGPQLATKTKNCNWNGSMSGTPPAPHHPLHQHPISACCCRRPACWCQMAAHTDVHSSLQLCQVLFSIGVRWPLWAETPLARSPLSTSTSSPCPCLALIWVSLASLVIVLLVWLINGDGACLDRTEERMNFKSPPPLYTPYTFKPLFHTHSHTHMNSMNFLLTARGLFERPAKFILLGLFSHTANGW